VAVNGLYMFFGDEKAGRLLCVLSVGNRTRGIGIGMALVDVCIKMGNEGETGMATVAAQLQYDRLDGGSCMILDGSYYRYSR